MKNPPVEDSSLYSQVVTLSDKSVVLKVRKANLKVLSGPERGKEVELHPPGLVVGSAPECNLSLSDPAVSRKHFQLKPSEMGYVLTDLKSKNGTLVGKLRVNEVILSGGEEIKVGGTKLRLVLLDKHDEYPLSSKTSFGPLLGRSVPMRQVFAVLERAAESETTVLLEGESGTGKDLAAESVHLFSRRRNQPFVVVDCGTIQASLVESELFGHKKGAFTGANNDRAGAFEAANGGTVFLDEIGELDLSIQPKLLRLLEKREVKRLGENSYRPVDVRLIAATNRDLSTEVESGRFREDLFYRLSVLRLRMPPLRERREDIVLLAKTFVQKLKPDADPVEVISDSTMSMFMNHDWPGNVRELKNAVERLLLFPESPALSIPQDSAEQQKAPKDIMRLPYHEARRRMTDHFERTYLSVMLDSCDGVVTRAAKLAEIPRQTFHRLMAKHGLTTW